MYAVLSTTTGLGIAPPLPRPPRARCPLQALLRRDLKIPQSETTPFYPRSPYAAAKLHAYWITVLRQERRGLARYKLFRGAHPYKRPSFAPCSCIAPHIIDPADRGKNQANSVS